MATLLTLRAMASEGLKEAALPALAACKGDLPATVLPTCGRGFAVLLRMLIIASGIIVSMITEDGWLRSDSWTDRLRNILTASRHAASGCCLARKSLAIFCDSFVSINSKLVREADF